MRKLSPAFGAGPGSGDNPCADFPAFFTVKIGIIVSVLTPLGRGADNSERDGVEGFSVKGLCPRNRTKFERRMCRKRLLPGSGGGIDSADLRPARFHNLSSPNSMRGSPPTRFGPPCHTGGFRDRSGKAPRPEIAASLCSCRVGILYDSDADSFPFPNRKRTRCW